MASTNYAAYPAHTDQTGGYPQVSPSAPPSGQAVSVVYPHLAPPAYSVNSSPYVGQPNYAPPVQHGGHPMPVAVPVPQQPGMPVMAQALPVNGSSGPMPLDPRANPEEAQARIMRAKDIMQFEMFGCDKDMGTCAVACCCPCVTFGQNKELAGKEFFPNCMTYALLWYCFGMPGAACASCGGRGLLKKAVGLPSDDCHEYLFHCCCAACVLTQEQRAIKVLTGRVSPYEGMGGGPAQDDMER